MFESVAKRGCYGCGIIVTIWFDKIDLSFELFCTGAVLSVFFFSFLLLYALELLPLPFKKSNITVNELLSCKKFWHTYVLTKTELASVICDIPNKKWMKYIISVSG